MDNKHYKHNMKSEKVLIKMKNGKGKKNIKGEDWLVERVCLAVFI